MSQQETAAAAIAETTEAAAAAIAETTEAAAAAIAETVEETTTIAETPDSGGLAQMVGRLEVMAETAAATIKTQAAAIAEIQSRLESQNNQISELFNRNWEISETLQDLDESEGGREDLELVELPEPEPEPEPEPKKSRSILDMFF